MWSGEGPLSNATHPCTLTCKSRSSRRGRLDLEGEGEAAGGVAVGGRDGHDLDGHDDGGLHDAATDDDQLALHGDDDDVVDQDEEGVEVAVGQDEAHVDQASPLGGELELDLQGDVLVHEAAEEVEQAGGVEALVVVVEGVVAVDGGHADVDAEVGEAVALAQEARGHVVDDQAREAGEVPEVLAEALSEQIVAAVVGEAVEDGTEAGGEFLARGAHGMSPFRSG
jgi:hypothetical protein